MTDQCIDLTLDTGGLPAHTYAFYRLREMRTGEIYELIVGEEPSLLMQGLAVQLRHGIHWEVVEAGPPAWRVAVHRREDVSAADLVDLLTRDHLRIDKLFAQALHLVNAGKVAQAKPIFHQYAEALRHHLEVENEVIVPRLDLPRSPQGDDPTSIMLHEHDEILQQTVMIEELFDEGMDDPGMLAPFFALISGQLAKHEWREENNLFPHWGRVLKNLQGEEGKLFEEVKARIGDVR